MATVRRFDRGSYSKAKRLDNGMLRADGVISRAGVFDYRNADGTVRKELRPPEEVFKRESMATFELAPLTLEHPSLLEHPEMVTTDNVADLGIGHVGDSVRQDGDRMLAPILVAHADGVDAVDAGTVELSCGYFCETEETPGIWNGQRYDAIQRNIRGNHVALTKKARGGSDLRLRLDAASAEMLDRAVPPTSDRDPAAEPGEATMAIKIRLDGVDVEVSEQAAQLLEKREKTHAQELDQLRGELKTSKSEGEKLQGKLDSATDELKTTKEKLAVAIDPKTQREAIRSRVELEKVAEEVLGEDARLDSLSDLEIKTRVVKKLQPSAKLDGKSEEYIQSRFDAVTEDLEERNPGLERVKRAAAGVAEDDDGGARIDSEDEIPDWRDAREKVMAEQREQYKHHPGTNGGSAK